MQAMLAADDVSVKPAATTVTWREPVEISSKASIGSVSGSDHGSLPGNFGQGSRPLSGGSGGGGQGSPTTAPTSLLGGRGDADSRNTLENGGGVPESVLIVPMEDRATTAELHQGLLGGKKVIRARSRPRRPDEASIII